MIITVGSVRGAPGVTSWSLLLAAAWPGDVDRVVLEADPDGGVMGARYGLGVEPGVVSLLAAARRSVGEVPVSEHGRRCGDVWVVPGPETAEQARGVWGSGADALAATLAADTRLWIVDAGRLHAATPVFGLAAASALVVLVSGGRDEDLVQLPARVAALPVPTAVLINGRCSHETGELEAFTHALAVWRVDSVDDLPVVAGAVLAPGRSRRSWLWRQAVDVATAAAQLAVIGRPAEHAEVDA